VVVFGRIINILSIRRTQLEGVIQDYNMLVKNPAGIKSPACPSIKRIFKMGVKKKDFVKRELRRIINPLNPN
jgi:hypothetical protein